MFNNIPPSGFPQIDLSQDVKRINAEISGMTNACTNIITDITAETATVTGNPISLSDALATDAISVVAEIEPSQDLHGYDKPWAGGAGKNKLNPSDIELGLYTNANFDVDASTVYCSGKAYVPAGIYTISFDKNVNIVRIVSDGTYSEGEGGTSNVRFYTVTTSSDGYIGFSWRDSTSSSTDWDISSPVMIEAGSTATSYAPYSNICPISGMDSVTVTTTDGTDTNSATITIGQTVYYGELDFTTGTLTMTHIEQTMSKDWGWEFSANTKTFYYQTSGKGIKKSVYTDAFDGICDSFAPAPANADWANGNYCGFCTSTAEGYRFSMPSLNGDAAAFALAIDGVKIVYPLATPTTLSLTPTTLAMLEGENEISTDAEVVNIEYIKNTLVGRVRRLEEEQ